jgi:ubiquinone/menaquinone biosynthesis C-methylase UbiE
MPLSDYLLYQLARQWPSPVADRQKRFGASAGTEEYHVAYTIEQFNIKVRTGLGVDVFDKDVLEIGCGHGGISCFLAVAGAKSVVGIDLNTKNLEYAQAFAQQIAGNFGPNAKLPLKFLEQNAYALKFPDASFDLVVADNSFEHFLEPQLVLRNVARVLRPGGKLLVPVFSSIYSKHALHLKNGLKVPWTNLFFSEKTIVRALERMAKDNPKLYEIYPGLQSQPQRVRDVRRYGDLNDITYKSFKQMARAEGFRIESFRPNGTRIVGRIVARIPLFRNSVVMDIFSTGAGSLLSKQVSSRNPVQ